MNPGAANEPGIGKRPPVLIFLVTEDWYFLSHRLPMALAAQRAGYEIHVATRLNDRSSEIEALGFRLHPLAWQRGNLNPLRLLAIIRDVRAVYQRCSPDIVHHVALQPVVVGSLAAVGLPFVRLNALAGLGFGFSSKSVRARLLRPWLSLLLRRLLHNPLAAVLVQNPDDRAVVSSFGVADHRVFTIPGSGVDVAALRPQPEPSGPITVTFVGRLLADKGIRAVIAAQDLLRQRGESIQLKIAGDRDPANPAAIPSAEIEEWKSRADVSVLGHVNDVGALWAGSHIAVLPSWREGLPKSLLEAAACGRAIVATDVPGCREIARRDVNALLIPVEDPEALADAIQRLAHDADLRQRFGAAGRDLVEREFSATRIGQDVVALYDSLLGRAAKVLPADTERG